MHLRTAGYLVPSHLRQFQGLFAQFCPTCVVRFNSRLRLLTLYDISTLGSQGLLNTTWYSLRRSCIFPFPAVQMACARPLPSYLYTPLIGPNAIRLFCLLPHEDEGAPVRGRLVGHSLQHAGERAQRYEALSYVWGTMSKQLSIEIGEAEFAVTGNLHAALKRLRDDCFERILWIDAICINQQDHDERTQQVGCMALIYASASSVIVWLGEPGPDCGDVALEDLRAAAAAIRVISPQPETTTPYREIAQRVFSLLNRPWFNRVWVCAALIQPRPKMLTNSMPGTPRGCSRSAHPDCLRRGPD